MVSGFGIKGLSSIKIKSIIFIIYYLRIYSIKIEKRLQNVCLYFSSKLYWESMSSMSLDFNSNCRLVLYCMLSQLWSKEIDSEVKFQPTQ